MNVSVLGLGHVGTVMLACLAREGHQVIALDIDRRKLDDVSAGRSPVLEEGLNDLVRGAVKSGRVQVSDSVAFAVERSDMSIVCVGTPSLHDGAQNLQAVERATVDIGAALRSKLDFHVVLVRSTVQPGTMERTVLPLLEQRSGKLCGQQFGLCFQPEFAREGSAIADHYDPSLSVIAPSDERTTELVCQICAHGTNQRAVTDFRTAELLKYACNYFHALKVTFANEVGRLGRALDVDAREVMQLFRLDKQLNISDAYLKPAFAFGGPCLRKDLRALRQLAVAKDVALPLLAGTLASNVAHIEYAFNEVMSTGTERVGFIGLSFKEGTDDLRESPLVDLASRLMRSGVAVSAYDPDVGLAAIGAVNRRLFESVMPDASTVLRTHVADVVYDADTLVIARSSPAIVDQLRDAVRADQFLLDLIGIAEVRALNVQYRGICW